MKKNLFCLQIFLIVMTVLTYSFLSEAQSLSSDSVPLRSSRVHVVTKKLVVRKRLPNGVLAAPSFFAIHGVTWDPSTRAPDFGPDPAYGGLTPYGFFFDSAGRAPQGHELFALWQQTEFESHYLQDIPLMQGMNVNTVRVYNDMNADPAITKSILDECYRRGIMVIMTVANAKMDFDSRRYLYVVSVYKNHPAILMWSLGNEWNFNLYFGYENIDQAIAATDTAAREIKALDRFHPVSSVLGDNFSSTPVTCQVSDPCCRPSDGKNNVPAIVKALPAIDVWGLNVYRGPSFGNLFDQWKATTSKPFYLAEFGIDSFASTSYQIVNCYQAGQVTGQDDQLQQASIDLGLWQQLKTQLSVFNKKGQALGGLVHQFNDSLWKVGSYHVGLGGLVDYDGPDNFSPSSDDDTSYDEYNSEGVYAPGSFPDQVSNEEYFGVVSADRVPKQVYWQLKDFYAKF